MNWVTTTTIVRGGRWMAPRIILWTPGLPIIPDGWTLLQVGVTLAHSLTLVSSYLTQWVIRLYQVWLFFVAVPLMMAYVTRYIFGTDKLRPNAFEVRGLNGASTGVVHCDDAAILSQWLKYITDNIMGLTHLQVNYHYHSTGWSPMIFIRLTRGAPGHS